MGSRKLIVGVNDLKTKFPDVAAEAYGWDPSTVTAGSGKKQDWRCKEGHIYSSLVGGRTNKGSGCPFCSGNQVLAGFNDLKTKFPDVAAEAYGWDPATVNAGTNQKKDWKCNEGHIYSSTANGRTGKGNGCAICSGKQLLVGFNDLKTKFPDVASEAYNWDPATVNAGTNQKKDWKCNKGHKYTSSVATRTRLGNGCPFCSGLYVLAGFNDLKSKFPEIAAESYGWDPTTVSGGTNQKKEWKCTSGHIYPATVESRTRMKSGCSVCSGMRVLRGFNDLQTEFPEIAAEAHGWDPFMVVSGTQQKKDWKCNKGHIYSSTVNGRTGKGCGCPFCARKKVLKGFNDLQTEFPEIAAESYGWDPSTVVSGTQQKKDWKCNKSHIYSSTVNSRTGLGCGCPFCARKKVLKGFNDLQTEFPEIAAESYGWDPSTVVSGTQQKKDWKCNKGHIYAAFIANRTSKGTGCSRCAEYGFNPEKDAWFYLMKRPGEQQLGITNDFSTRIKRHENNGWTLLEHTTVPSKGQKVLDTENALKKWLKKEIGLMEGTTENWSTTKMEVQSLAELKARSGIETDLF